MRQNAVGLRKNFVARGALAIGRTGQRPTLPSSGRAMRGIRHVAHARTSGDPAGSPGPLAAGSESRCSRTRVREGHPPADALPRARNRRIRHTGRRLRQLPFDGALGSNDASRRPMHTPCHSGDSASGVSDDTTMSRSSVRVKCEPMRSRQLSWQNDAIVGRTACAAAGRSGVAGRNINHRRRRASRAPQRRILGVACSRLQVSRSTNRRARMSL
jgi:hypothetical protein